MSASGQQVRKGEKEEKRQAEEERSLWRRAGWMDGWVARQGEEAGREGNEMEEKDKQNAVGGGIKRNILDILL